MSGFYTVQIDMRFRAIEVASCRQSTAPSVAGLQRTRRPKTIEKKDLVQQHAEADRTVPASCADAAMGYALRTCDSTVPLDPRSYPALSTELDEPFAPPAASCSHADLGSCETLACSTCVPGYSARVL